MQFNHLQKPVTFSSTNKQNLLVGKEINDQQVAGNECRETPDSATLHPGYGSWNPVRHGWIERVADWPQMMRFVPQHILHGLARRQRTLI